MIFRVSKAAKRVYAEFFSFYKTSLFFFFLLMATIAALTFWEFFIGMKFLSSAGALAFEDTGSDGRTHIYVIIFLALFICEKILTRSFNKFRLFFLRKADLFIENKAKTLPEPWEDSSAYACRGAFGGLFDGFALLLREASLGAAFALFSLYANPYAGVPAAAIILFVLYKSVAEKPVKPIFSLLTSLFSQVYFISLIFLILLRYIPYGGIIGFYAFIMFKMYGEKDIPEEWTKFVTAAKRLEELESVFESPPRAN